jgi:hypothetical protein
MRPGNGIENSPGTGILRHGRSSAFLKNSHVIPRAVSIFLENLFVDGDGKILNYDEAEERGAEYIRNNC